MSSSPSMYFTDQNIMQRERDPMGLSFECLEMHKWNIKTDGAQRSDEKNEVICLVIMFNSGGMAIKMLKIARNLCFLLISESQSQLWQNT